MPKPGKSESQPQLPARLGEICDWISQQVGKWSLPQSLHVRKAASAADMRNVVNLGIRALGSHAFGEGAFILWQRDLQAFYIAYWVAGGQEEPVGYLDFFGIDPAVRFFEHVLLCDGRPENFENPRAERIAVAAVPRGEWRRLARIDLYVPALVAVTPTRVSPQCASLVRGHICVALLREACRDLAPFHNLILRRLATTLVEVAPGSPVRYHAERWAKKLGFGKFDAYERLHPMVGLHAALYAWPFCGRLRRFFRRLHRLAVFLKPFMEFLAWAWRLVRNLLVVAGIAI